MKRSTIPNILFLLPADQLSRYTSLLQSGAIVTTNTGIGLQDFLSALPGFSHKDNEKIDTIFLDGVPVDDLGKKFNRPAHTLALSAVMPGLAAAIFRRNSIHSALRSRIETRGTEAAEGMKCTVRLKLFNTIARDYGILLFKQGVCMNSEPLLKTFSRRKILLDRIEEIQYENRVIDATELIALLGKNPQIFLRIQGI
ncbi:hypothetical protein [Desulfotalea psychrophila]|uniref:Uncharacterized protein n=1 Tax=Desulfotalea psychrophila (strain LSv54 / DSM 12343) TaxID=177439 RepID=Q6AKC3_DESPS|nr:hypothetical protein [Desulfotalea psychrophila]CAG37202.1 unknown protein [Desulfotalea psychrophila LSv54]